MSDRGDLICATCGHPRRFHWLNTDQGERLGIFAEACAASTCECAFFTPAESLVSAGAGAGTPGGETT